MRNLRISKTFYPPKKLDFNEWANEIGVSKLYDSEVFNDKIIYDEYLRKMRLYEVEKEKNKKNKSSIVSFINKIKLNN